MQSCGWSLATVASSLTVPDLMIFVDKLRLHVSITKSVQNCSTVLLLYTVRSRNKHLTCRTLWPVEKCCFMSIQYTEHLYAYLTACLTLTLTSFITQSNECQYFLNLTCVHCAVQNKTLMTYYKIIKTCMDFILCDHTHLSQKQNSNNTCRSTNKTYRYEQHLYITLPLMNFEIET